MDIDPAALDRRSAYRLLISCVIPRPIAFVTTLSKQGVTNLAPFSFFNGVSSTPPIVSISVGSRKEGRKDTWVNIEETGEFVVNVVVPELMDGVIIGAKDLPHNVSELELAKLKTLPSAKVKPPRLADSPIQMECVRYKIVEVEGTALILGRVAMFHVRDEVFREGRVDPRLMTFVGRLGDELYCRVTDIFERKREP